MMRLFDPALISCLALLVSCQGATDPASQNTAFAADSMPAQNSASMAKSPLSSAVIYREAMKREGPRRDNARIISPLSKSCSVIQVDKLLELIGKYKSSAAIEKRKMNYFYNSAIAISVASKKVSIFYFFDQKTKKENIEIDGITYWVPGDFGNQVQVIANFDCGDKWSKLG